MAFRRSSPARHAKSELILRVGSHAYVNWAPPAAGQPVPMIDGSGKWVGNDLADGQEVEILSWRPRSRDGLSYQIRRLEVVPLLDWTGYSTRVRAEGRWRKTSSDGQRSGRWSCCCS